MSVYYAEPMNNVSRNQPSMAHVQGLPGMEAGEDFHHEPEIMYGSCQTPVEQVAPDCEQGYVVVGGTPAYAGGANTATTPIVASGPHAATYNKKRAGPGKVCVIVTVVAIIVIVLIVLLLLACCVACCLLGKCHVSTDGGSSSSWSDQEIGPNVVPEIHIDGNTDGNGSVIDQDGGNDSNINLVVKLKNERLGQTTCKDLVFSGNSFAATGIKDGSVTASVDTFANKCLCYNGEACHEGGLATSGCTKYDCKDIPTVKLWAK